MVEALRREDGLVVEILPFHASHKDSMKDLAGARISVSLGISGGIDTTMLESMSLGVFPLTSCATCANEWLEDGRDGFLINPHDIAGLVKAITIAVTDDAMVDEAYARNREKVMRRWNAASNGRSIQDHYRMVLNIAKARRKVTPA
jgi:glycosyltransferase involved in cell wall biosynthesis